MLGSDPQLPLLSKGRGMMFLCRDCKRLRLEMGGRVGDRMAVAKEAARVAG